MYKTFIYRLSQQGLWCHFDTQTLKDLPSENPNFFVNNFL